MWMVSPRTGTADTITCRSVQYSNHICAKVGARSCRSGFSLQGVCCCHPPQTTQCGSRGQIWNFPPLPTQTSLFCLAIFPGSRARQTFGGGGS